MDPNEDIKSMFDRFSTIFNQLKEFGEEILEDRLIRKLIYSLPQSWDSKKTAIIEAKDLKKLKLDELIGSLLTHEFMCIPLKRENEKIIKEQGIDVNIIALKSSKCKYEDSSMEESSEEDEEMAYLFKNFTRLMKSEKEKSKHEPKKKMKESHRNKSSNERHTKYDCPRFNKKGSSSKKAYVATWSDECWISIPYQWYRYPIPTLESGYRYMLERVSVPLVMHQVSIPELGYRYPYIFTRYRYQGRGIGTQAPHWDLSIVEFLTATQRYAAGALFAIALNQAQIHQTRLLGLRSKDDHPFYGNRRSSSSSNDSVSEDPDLWVNENSGLLRPIFRFLDIDSAAWLGLEETAASSPAKHHLGAFLRLLAEEGEEGTSERLEQEIALSKAVDSMASSMETNSKSSQVKKEKSREYEQECREKYSPAEVPSNSVVANQPIETPQESDTSVICGNDDHNLMDNSLNEKPVEGVGMLTYHRKVMVLYELLSASLAAAETSEDSNKYNQRRKGYDARHRVALRLLTTWFDIEWIKMVCNHNLLSLFHLFYLGLAVCNVILVRAITE
ncbi:hypothetical protein GQ457_04G020770 [Hibiscus cannabinus]